MTPVRHLATLHELDIAQQALRVLEDKCKHVTLLLVWHDAELVQTNRWVVGSRCHLVSH